MVLMVPATFIDVAVERVTVIANVALTLEFSERVTVGSRAAGALAEKTAPPQYGSDGMNGRAIYARIGRRF